MSRQGTSSPSNLMDNVDQSERKLLQALGVPAGDATPLRFAATPEAQSVAGVHQLETEKPTNTGQSGASKTGPGGRPGEEVSPELRRSQRERKPTRRALGSSSKYVRHLAEGTLLGKFANLSQRSSILRDPSPLAQVNSTAGRGSSNSQGKRLAPTSRDSQLSSVSGLSISPSPIPQLKPPAANQTLQNNTPPTTSARAASTASSKTAEGSRSFSPPAANTRRSPDEQALQTVGAQENKRLANGKQAARVTRGTVKTQIPAPPSAATTEKWPAPVKTGMMVQSTGSPQRQRNQPPRAAADTPKGAYHVRKRQLLKREKNAKPNGSAAGPRAGSNFLGTGVDP